MLDKIRNLLLGRLLHKENSGRSISLGRRLQLYLALLVFTLLVCISLLLFFLNIFPLPSESIAEEMKGGLKEYKLRVSSYFSSTAAQGIRLSELMTREIEKTLVAEGVGFEELSDNPELIERLQKNTYDILHGALLVGDCSGAFVVFDATVNTTIPPAAYSRSGMYLRLLNFNTPTPVNPEMVWLRGVPTLGAEHNHFFHNHWELEFSLRNLPFYKKLKEFASPQLTDCYLYPPKMKLPGTWETMILLCVPMVSQSGKFYGMCGLEISSTYFKLAHMAGNGGGQRFTGLVARRKNDCLLPTTGLESGTSSGYFAGLDAAPLREENISGKLRRYTSSSRSFVGFACPIRLSPLFADDSWNVAYLMPEEDYENALNSYIGKALTACIIFMLVAFGVSWWISRRCIRPLLYSIDAVKTGAANQTNVLEIDDLIQFLNQQNADDPSEPEADMSGFYAFKENICKLSPAERAVFNLYLEDFSAQKIADVLYISINTVKSHNKRIYAKLGVSSRKELMIYIKMLKVNPNALPEKRPET
ncbi:MAG: LuxR family transcriptional regulator [Desulfovibrionaceae bacterium]|nr:LuxR family transcriptional regulator [Desulfovibrionaceae bacterium]